MRILGIDIGTTTICAAVVDGSTGDLLESATIPSNAFIETENEWEKIQDCNIISSIVNQLADKFTEKYKPISAIGFTGQMHGIVYTDENGNAVSPLFTWQDGRGDLEYRDGKSYAEYLSDLTGYKLATGFGSVTHFYNQINGLVPKNAKHFCTIHDFMAMKLARLKVPLTHISDAASLGLCKQQYGCFDEEAIKKAGMDPSIYPVIAKENTIGTTAANIPVTVALGDNQASFIGSVRCMEDSVLINIGTGSQISIFSPKFATVKALETRPCVENTFLFVGSGLCGGRSYAILEHFFREIANLAGADCKNMYKYMDKLSEGYRDIKNKLDISTRFSGTRDNPTERGYIKNICIDNLTAQNVVCGFLEGTANELYNQYRDVCGDKKPAMLIGSGNGIRKSPVLQRMFADRFGVDMKVTRYGEEAAYGAALFALVDAGHFGSITEVQKMIKYQDD
jgi:sedoheptulokinase